MAETADQMYARITSSGERLPAPGFVDWPTFPLEADAGDVIVRDLPAPAAEEPRKGESNLPCPICAPPQDVIWQDDAWRVKPHPERSGLPLVLFLESHEHLDFHELDEDQAADMGRLSVRVARIVESIDGIGRCHVMRFGDGCSHVHVWFLARPAGLGALRGSFAQLWDDSLPPGPEDVWRADLATVARKLATHGGEALV